MTRNHPAGEPLRPYGWGRAARGCAATLAVPLVLLLAAMTWFVGGRHWAAWPMLRACDAAQSGMAEVEFRTLLAQANPEFVTDSRDSIVGAGDGARGLDEDGTYRVNGYRTFVFYRAVCGATFDVQGRLVEKRFSAFD